MRGLRLAQFAAYRRLFGPGPADQLVDGWRALGDRPELVRDLCHLGHLFESDVDPATGQIYEPPVLIARAARKSMALALLARAEITEGEMNLVRQGDRGNVEQGMDGDGQ